MPKMSRAALKRKIKEFRLGRTKLKELKESIDGEQPSLLAFLKEFDPENQGFVFDDKQPDGKNAAFRSGGDNTPEEERVQVWDMQAITDYLNDPNNVSLRKKCSVRVISIDKFEAEVAAGNVPAGVAKGFKKPKPPTTEYINFQRPKTNSK